MTVLSRLSNLRQVMVHQVRHGGGIGGQVENRPSRWSYDMFKDYLHLYTLIGLIPCGLLVIGSNLFIGTAVLKPIPEGYEPKEEEYYKSPITRWFVRHVYKSYQQQYEMRAASIWQDHKRGNIRQLYDEVARVQKLNTDYKGWFVKENDAGMYLRMAMQDQKLFIEEQGND